MSIAVLDCLINLLYLSLAIPIVLLLIRFRLLLPSSKWMTAVLSLSLLSAITSEILYRNNLNPNYAASAYYVLVAFPYVFFFDSITSLRALKRPIYYIAATHVAFATMNVLYFQKDGINTHSGISLSVIVVFLSLVFYYRLLKEMPSQNLLAVPIFWFVTADFLVHIGQMLMKSFAHFLITIFDDNLIVLWVFHHGLAVGGNILISVGAWLAFTQASREQLPARYD